MTTGGVPGKGYEYDTVAGDVCKKCGCVVGDKALHATFHASLTRTATQADSADAYTHVIGGPPQ